MQRKQFTFYRSFYDAVMKLPRLKRQELLMALVEYALNRTEPVGLTAMQQGQFILIRPILDAAWRRAEEGAMGKRGPAEKNNKGEKEIEIEKEIKTETEGFLQFWQRYPVKLGRTEARAQWECVQQESEQILLGLDRWLCSKSWMRENGRFIPKAEKWLKERWWEQVPEQTVPKGASGRLGKAEMEAIERLFE